MKVVILAGGYGTRISEETMNIPKPLVEIGNYPILWHIMKIFSHHGFNEFIVCCGYKSHLIKEYFKNYYLRNCDVEVDLRTNTIKLLNDRTEDWQISLIETGQDVMTGGRLLRIKDMINGPFLMTYGDGVSDVDIPSLIKFHKSAGGLVTLTGIPHQGRYGTFSTSENNKIKSFSEKPLSINSRINGGFFVIDPKALDYIEGDNTSWENEPLSMLADKGLLSCYNHDGFWHSMDTLRDKIALNELWMHSAPPWKKW